MITRLTGTVLEATPLSVVLDVRGVGYEVHVPVTTAERLPPAGHPVTVFTELVVREDAHVLYGFATREDRELFRLLTQHVTGVGPKVALAILSSLSSASLRAAIVAGDLRVLSQCHGVGKKTAERIVIELREKLGGLAGSPAAGLAPAATPAGASPTLEPAPATVAADPIADAVLALLALGYKAPEADKAVRAAAVKLGPGAATEALVKAALR